MVRHVAEHRFMRSTHFVKLMQRPHDKILRRLGALFHHSYLDRPHAQLEAFTRGGSAPMVYALGFKAARLFGAPDSIGWTDKNRDVKRPYIEHELLKADFMVALECALRAHPTIRLLRAADIAADVRRASGLKPKHWTMTATVPPENVEISAAPDKVFGLEFSDTGRRNYFFLEVDRSTMPISRPELDQSSFKKKFLAYHFGHRAKQHVALWGIPGFRVLTMTTSAERIASMIDVVTEITRGKGSNVFLFADVASLADADPLTMFWKSGKDGFVRLAPTE